MPDASDGAPSEDADVRRSAAAGLSCKAIDILFVIDNSSSMGPHQTSLAYAFPSFIDSIYEKLPPGASLHVGITTTSFYVGNCNEGPDGTCHSGASPADIRGHYLRPSEANTGENGGQGRLFRYSGRFFFDTTTSASDREQLKSWFSGAATAVGVNGCTFEMPTAGAASVLDVANAASNTGFLRDANAVFLIVFLTDEPDKSPDTTATYTGMLRQAKRACGGDRCIVTAGLVDPCITRNDVGDPLWSFLNGFGRPPVWGDINGISTQYQHTVGAALAEVVRRACTEIVVQ